MAPMTADASVTPACVAEHTAAQLPVSEQGTDSSLPSGRRAVAVWAAGGAIAAATDLELPSGRKARVREGTGRDILRASRMVDTTKDGAMALSMAMIAVKATIDGQALTFEEVCDLPDSDVWVLMGACTGKGLSSPPTT